MEELAPEARLQESSPVMEGVKEAFLVRGEATLLRFMPPELTKHRCETILAIATDLGDVYIVRVISHDGQVMLLDDESYDSDWEYQEAPYQCSHKPHLHIQELHCIRMNGYIVDIDWIRLPKDHRGIVVFFYDSFVVVHIDEKPPQPVPTHFIGAKMNREIAGQSVRIELTKGAGCYTGDKVAISLSNAVVETYEKNEDGTREESGRWHVGDVVTCLAHNPGNDRDLVAGLRDGTLVWMAFDRGIIRNYNAVGRGHDSSVIAIRHDATGNYIASTGNDGVINLWDMRRPNVPVNRIEGLDSITNSLCFSSSVPNRLFSKSIDGILWEWNTRLADGLVHMNNDPNLHMWQLDMDDQEHIIMASIGSDKHFVHIWRHKDIESAPFIF